jgi:putative toxin-antitoxin system antitoxin component (TIGR02293 family)
MEREAMQLDATLQLPDGKRIPVVVELDAAQLESSLADTGFADLVARAVEVLGSRPQALAWLRTPLTGLNGLTPLQAMAGAEGRQEVEDVLGRIEHGVFG